MDEEVRARLDKMDQRIDGAMYGISTALWAMFKDPKIRLEVMGNISHFLSDGLSQEEAPPAFLEGMRMVRDRILVIEKMDQMLNRPN